MAKNGDVYDAPEFDIEVGRVENCIKLIPKNNLARRIGMLLCGEEEIELDYSNQGEQNNV